MCSYVDLYSQLFQPQDQLKKVRNVERLLKIVTTGEFADVAPCVGPACWEDM